MSESDDKTQTSSSPIKGIKDSMQSLANDLKFRFGETEEGQSLYDYFTKDYKEEVVQARKEAEEELFIPLPDDDQDGYVNVSL